MQQTLPSRQLAIILHADIVGSTALVQVDESVAHYRMQGVFKRFSKIIQQYGGITHELRGDALVAKFGLASNAVSASLYFQRENTRVNSEYKDSILPEVRVGIAMGEVIIADNTITGTGVILAQRLEQLALSGGVVIQNAIFETIPKRLPFEFTNLGEQHLKGFDTPVTGFSVALTPGAKIPEADTVISTDKIQIQESPKPAIAVLPFKNMSGDPEQEYFSDGISEDIITALSYFRSFPVISRNSSFSYKNQATNIADIGRELNVKYIVDGGIRKSGSRLRITAQLIDAENGHQLWTSKFDRNLDDIFEIQDEISEIIVTKIQPELTHAELEKVAAKRPENLTAWDLVLRGMSLVTQFSRDEANQAESLFRQAIELDPTYPDAWSGLAWVLLYGVLICDPGEREKLIEEGFNAAQKAVKLDDRSAMAHYVLGVGHVWKEDFQAGIREGELSIELNPYNATAHMGLGNRLDLIGRTDEGIEKLQYALQFNPRDPRRGLCMVMLSRANSSIENYEEALRWAKEAVSVSSENPDFHYRLAICLANLDCIEEAQKNLQLCEKLKPGFLKERKAWLPYSNPERNQKFFQGMWKHNLLEPV